MMFFFFSPLFFFYTSEDINIHHQAQDLSNKLAGEQPYEPTDQDHEMDVLRTMQKSLFTFPETGIEVTLRSTPPYEANEEPTTIEYDPLNLLVTQVKKKTTTFPFSVLFFSRLELIKQKNY